jgi:hypothetical protein
MKELKMKKKKNKDNANAFVINDKINLNEDYLYDVIK